MRKVTIMCGVPGSGKSHWINNQVHAGVICSADHYFMDQGKYNFNPALLGDAHGKCLRNFVQYLQEDEDHVIVDNTNTTITEITPYYALAKAYAYEVEIVWIRCPVQIAAMRNTHGVPSSAIHAMHSRLELMGGLFPAFWDIERTIVETG